MDVILYLVFFMDLRKNTNDIFYFIAKKILQNIHQIPEMGIETLAEICYTSPATISRFCKHVSLNNYSHLKSEITLALQNYERSRANIASNLPKTTKKIAMQSFSDDIKSIKSTYRALDFATLDQCIELIDQVDYIAVFGNAYSQLAARDFQYKFLRLNKFVTSFTDHNDQIDEALTMPTHGLAIFFSISGKEDFNNQLACSLQNRGVKIIALTQYSDSFLAQHANLVLNSFDETCQNNEGNGSLYGRISLMSLVDAIFNLYIFKKKRSWD
ncbi:MAG: MurR/RpiR family transcriptional regulator [Culicoidibacterales bacterium]